MNSSDGFGLIKGTATEVDKYLQELKFCSNSEMEDIKVFFSIDEVDLDKVDSEGLIKSQNESSAGYVAPSVTGAKGPDPTGFTKTNICT